MAPKKGRGKKTTGEKYSYLKTNYSIGMAISVGSLFSISSLMLMLMFVKRVNSTLPLAMAPTTITIGSSPSGTSVLGTIQILDHKEV